MTCVLFHSVTIMTYQGFCVSLHILALAVSLQQATYIESIQNIAIFKAETLRNVPITENSV